MNTGDTGTPSVKGEIVIQAVPRAFDNATVHIYLEDVSLADAVAPVVAETVIAAVRHVPSQGDTNVHFVLVNGSSAAIDARHHYSVRVWVDCDNDGQQSHDDLYSDQVYPVLTHGFGNTVIITVGAA